jgi:hypothetical protein
MVMKNPVFQNIMLCNMLKVNHRFRGTSHLYLQSPKVSQARNQLEANGTLQKECCAYIFKLAYCAHNNGLNTIATKRRNQSLH